MRLVGRIAPVALAAASVAALWCTALAAQSAAPRAAAQPERLAGTVIASDVRGRTVDLLTGVGHALRVRRLHLPAGVTITYRGAPSTFSALTRGCIVRIECSGAPSGPVASTVELLEAAPAGKP
jgi:hypothetical protein